MTEKVVIDIEEYIHRADTVLYARKARPIKTRLCDIHCFLPLSPEAANQERLKWKTSTPIFGVKGDFKNDNQQFAWVHLTSHLMWRNDEMPVVACLTKLDGEIKFHRLRDVANLFLEKAGIKIADLAHMDELLVKPLTQEEELIIKSYLKNYGFNGMVLTSFLKLL